MAMKMRTGFLFNFNIILGFQGRTDYFFEGIVFNRFNFFSCCLSRVDLTMFILIKAAVTVIFPLLDSTKIIITEFIIMINHQ